MVRIFKSETILGFTVKLEFVITQHSKDELLLRRGPRRTHWMRRGPLNVMVRPSRLTVARAAHCGYVSKNNSDTLNFTVTKFSDLEKIIIPFFKKYRILGIKGAPSPQL